jgi:hypothetical protein
MNGQNANKKSKSALKINTKWLENSLKSLKEKIIRIKILLFCWNSKLKLIPSIKLT